MAWVFSTLERASHRLLLNLRSHSVSVIHNSTGPVNRKHVLYSKYSQLERILVIMIYLQIWRETLHSQSLKKVNQPSVLP
jgi:hypothetical protein